MKLNSGYRFADVNFLAPLDCTIAGGLHTSNPNGLGTQLQQLDAFGPVRCPYRFEQVDFGKRSQMKPSSVDVIDTVSSTCLSLFLQSWFRLPLMALQILQQLGCPRRSHNIASVFCWPFGWYSTYIQHPVQINGINMDQLPISAAEKVLKKPVTLDKVHLPTLPQRESNQEPSRGWEQGLGTCWSGLDRGLYLWNGRS